MILFSCNSDMNHHLCSVCHSALFLRLFSRCCCCCYFSSSSLLRLFYLFFSSFLPHVPFLVELSLSFILPSFFLCFFFFFFYSVCVRLLQRSLIYVEQITFPFLSAQSNRTSSSGGGNNNNKNNYKVCGKFSAM